jgi:hypothetical protein
MNKSRKFAALAIITLIFTLANSKASAQYDEGEDPMYVPEKRVFHAGVVGGINQSQVDGDYYAGYFKTGANVGGIVYAQLKKHLALSMEILYSQKGSKSNGPQPSPALGTDIITKYGININYAEVPIMINYFDQRKSHAGIGFSVSRLVNSNEVLQIDSFNQVKTENLNMAYPFKKTGFDFLAGVDLHLVQGLFLNIRFQYSIIPIRSGTDLPPIEYARATQYNNMWVIRLMYLFR